MPGSSNAGPSGHLLVDDRIGSGELQPMLRKMGLPATVKRLDCADFAWGGKGPDGEPMRIGVERKKLSELLTCFGDSRFVSRQLPQLLQTYDVCWLLVEGVYSVEADGRMTMGRLFGPHQAHSYDAVAGFLLTLQQKAGLRVVRTASVTETLWWLHTAYRWWQKDWAKHHSAYALDTVRVPYDAAIAQAPNLVRLMAAQLPGIGWAKSELVAKHFATVTDMVQAGWRTWTKIEGIGEVSARRIVGVLRGTCPVR